QRIGKRLGVPAPGCEVSRIWPLRLVVMAVSRASPASQRISKMQKAPRRREPNERPPTSPYFGGKAVALQGVTYPGILILRRFLALHCAGFGSAAARLGPASGLCAQRIVRPRMAGVAAPHLGFHG